MPQGKQQQNKRQNCTQTMQMSPQKALCVPRCNFLSACGSNTHTHTHIYTHHTLRGNA